MPRPAPLKVYVYKNCDTCRRALRHLDDRGTVYQAVAIRETPPSRAELERMLKFQGGDVRRLFNVSGRDYRELGLKDRIGTMTSDEAIALLAGDGNLVKRPFALSRDAGAVGFRADEWDEKFPA